MAEPSVIRKLDETVVNRIAAGEVIQRPANALKEMLENSLDAGSSQITVTVRNGGLKLLQIQDNGTGIRKEDLTIVAERFTTSKLREFSDLSSIATFGFRGEALASISHVAHLSLVTKTRNSPCGFKCEYLDGELQGAVKPMAANQGTTITVEDLFYNVPTRRAALRSHAEEFNKISDVMSKYAIHNKGVGFALKKAGETGVELKTMVSNSIVDNIRTVYGPSVAKELIDFSVKDEKYKIEAVGKISNVNYSVKKMVFILFINHRLVDSTALKKAIEHVYASYLPKGSSPFIYLSLSIAPQNVDVNVHPTKHEVFFLHQDAIIEKLQRGLEESLLNSNASRTFYTQKLLPGAAPAKVEILEGDKAIAAKDMVRTDSKEQKLDKFLLHQNAVSDLDKENAVGEKSKETEVKSRGLQLSSVKSLRQEMLEEGSKEAREILADHIFVGCVDQELALVQHQTRLFLTNTTKLSKFLFRQLLLKNFGEHGVFRLSPSARVSDLARMALDLEEVGWSPEHGDKDTLVGVVIDTLGKHKEMLADYFSLEFEEIDSELYLSGLPILLDGYCPWLGGLPLFILRLSSEVSFDSERKCFDDLIKETADFYSVKKNGEGYDVKQHVREAGESEDETWKQIIEQTLYPAFKKHLFPPSCCLTDKTLLQVANLPDLYKVFERC